MNYIESIYIYCKMLADILEQARDFVQSDYDSGKIFSDEDTRNGREYKNRFWYTAEELNKTED